MNEGDVQEVIVPLNNDLERKIADVFEIFDHTDTKSVDAREIGTIVRALGCCPTEAEVQEIVVATENPATPGNVHLVDFLPYATEMLMEHKHQPASPEQLLKAFQALDKEGRGFLTREHITTLMTEDGEPFTQDELDEMLEIAIDPHTQTIPYEYYINQLMYEPVLGENLYKIADRVKEESKPLEEIPKNLSRMLEAMQKSLKNLD